MWTSELLDCIYFTEKTFELRERVVNRIIEGNYDPSNPKIDYKGLTAITFYLYRAMITNDRDLLQKTNQALMKWINSIADAPSEQFKI